MTKKNKDTKAEPVTPLPTRKEKEMELDSLLTAEEEANYDRINKQGKSDEIDDEVVEVAKDIYRKSKSAVKGFVKGAKDSVKGIVKGAKDIASGKKTFGEIEEDAKAAGEAMGSAAGSMANSGVIAKAKKMMSGDTIEKAGKDESSSGMNKKMFSGDKEE